MPQPAIPPLPQSTKLNHQRVFYIQPKQIKLKFNIIEIAGDDFHHLVHVLRLKPGAKIICKTYQGLHYSCTLQTLKSLCAIFIINKIQKTKPALIPQRKIGIFLCIPRPNVLGNIVAKLTEIGIDFLQLVFSERSFFKNSTKLNLPRYEKIRQETLKQCTSNTLLELKAPINLKNLTTDFNSFLPSLNSATSTKQVGENVQNSPNQLSFAKNKIKIHKILLWECETTHSLAMDEWLKSNPHDPVFLFVGPEGGISQLEKQYLVELGFESKSVSPNILKVETALLLALGKIL